MCGVVDVCLVDAEETKSETHSNGEKVSEGIDCGIKETKLIGFLVRNIGCLFDSLPKRWLCFVNVQKTHD